MKLKEHQEIGVQAALPFRDSGYCYFCEMRTGKTLMSLALAKEIAPKRLLVACPTIAVKVWQAELRNLTVPGCIIRVTTIGKLWNRRKELKRWKPDMFILDESHRIKERGTRQSRAARGIAKHSGFKLALTGTPLEKGQVNTWAQYDFIDPSIFGKFSEFEERYLVKGGFQGRKVIGYRREDELNEIIRSRYYRVTLEEVKEKPTTYRVARIRFPLREAKGIYNQMETEFKADVRGKRVRAPIAISKTMKLHQITGGFIFDEEKVAHPVGSEKLEALMDLVGRLQAPLVIIARFIPEIEAIKSELERRTKYTVQVIRGGKKKGGERFTEFHADVAIMQIQSGVAINLSKSENIIFYSVNSSFLDFEQASFRILSLDSERAHYYFLLAEDTVDELIYQSLREKRSLSKLVIDYMKETNHVY